MNLKSGWTVGTRDLELPCKKQSLLVLKIKKFRELLKSRVEEIICASYKSKYSQGYLNGLKDALSLFEYIHRDDL